MLALLTRMRATGGAECCQINLLLHQDISHKRVACVSALVDGEPGEPVPEGGEDADQRDAERAPPGASSSTRALESTFRADGLDCHHPWRNSALLALHVRLQVFVLFEHVDLGLELR